MASHASTAHRDCTPSNAAAASSSNQRASSPPIPLPKRLGSMRLHSPASPRLARDAAVSRLLGDGDESAGPAEPGFGLELLPHDADREASDSDREHYVEQWSEDKPLNWELGVPGCQRLRGLIVARWGEDAAGALQLGVPVACFSCLFASGIALGITSTYAGGATVTAAAATGTWGTLGFWKALATGAAGVVDMSKAPMIANFPALAKAAEASIAAAAVASPPTAIVASAPAASALAATTASYFEAQMAMAAMAQWSVAAAVKAATLKTAIAASAPAAAPLLSQASATAMSWLAVVPATRLFTLFADDDEIAAGSEKEVVQVASGGASLNSLLEASLSEKRSTADIDGKDYGRVFL